MTTFLQLAFLLSIILLGAKLAGYLSVRLGQPSVLSELLVGILVGPSVVDRLYCPSYSMPLGIGSRSSVNWMNKEQANYSFCSGAGLWSKQEKVAIVETSPPICDVG